MIVIDTNVLVSALLTPNGTCAYVVDWALAQPQRWLVTFGMLDEYHHVLHRPQFGFDPTTVDALLHMLAGNAYEDVPALKVNVRAADRFDVMFYSAAVGYGAVALVTGNRTHYPRRPEVPVLAPGQFVALDGV